MTTTEKSATAVTWAGNRGSVVLRTAMLTSHYTQNHEWKDESIKEAEQVWCKLWERAEKCDDPAPAEIVKAIENDFDTPEAMKQLLVMAQKGRKRDVYAAMRFLGLLPLDGEPVPTTKGG